MLSDDVFFAVVNDVLLQSLDDGDEPLVATMFIFFQDSILTCDATVFPSQRGFYTGWR